LELDSCALSLSVAKNNSTTSSLQLLLSSRKFANHFFIHPIFCQITMQNLKTLIVTETIYDFAIC